MKQYYRLMLGAGSAHAAESLAGQFIGVDFEIKQDLAGKLPDDLRTFNEKFIPVFLENHPDKNKIGAGLACGAVWTVAKGMNNGDTVLCPDGSGQYLVGEVVGPYSYVPVGPLPHRRSVKWLTTRIARSDMSEALKRSTGSIGTVSNITPYAVEIETLLAGEPLPTVISTDESVEDPAAFVMENHLEEFLVQNWKHTVLGKSFDIYSENGEQVGEQYITDTGPLDILAVSKDKKQLLVVELKKGRASDAVVGQTLRYMGYVQSVLAEPGQKVIGAIVAVEDDQRIRRALSVAPTITFYRYKITFELVKAN
jgi:restriction system protein